MISEEQEERIIEEVNKSAIKNEGLRDDLIDHLCCLTEINLNKGHDFQQSMKMAFEQTCPNGLNEIEKETIFLLNYSKIMLMKKVTYIIGYLFALTWIAGILMKLLHLAGAGMLLGIGTLGFLGLFFPLLLINRYKHVARGVLSERMKWILGGLSVALLVGSITMKMLHMEGSAFMLFISFILFGIGFLPFLFFSFYRKSTEEI